MTRKVQFAPDSEALRPDPLDRSPGGRNGGEPQSPKQPEDVLRFITELAQLGDVAGYNTVCGRVFLVNHPELIRRVMQSERYERSLLIGMALGEGLLTTEGEPWLSRRRLLQPSFSRQKLASFAPLMMRATTDMLDRWEAVAQAGGTIDVADEMTGLTLRIIVGALFGVDIGKEPSDLPQAFSTIIGHLSRCGYVQFNIPQQVSAADRARYQRAIDRVDDFVYGIVRQRRKNSVQPDDLLSALLKAYGQTDADGGRLDTRLRDEMLTLILAGHETSATAIAWTWHLLSQHPDVERRLHDELDAVLAGRLPQPGDLSKLTLLKRIFQESMRVYPPVWFIGRKAVQDDRLMGVSIPAGAPIIVSPYTMHRHPQFWESPNLFDPDRFLPGRAAGQAQTSYIPFGAGPHLCIGSHLAMLEGQTIIAAIAQRFRLRAVEGFPVEPEPLFTLRQRYGLRMSPVERHEAPANAADTVEW